MNAAQTALERVREINIGMTASLKALTEHKLQAAVASYDHQASRG